MRTTRLPHEADRSDTDPSMKSVFLAATPWLFAAVVAMLALV